VRPAALSWVRREDVMGDWVRLAAPIPPLRRAAAFKRAGVRRGGARVISGTEDGG
jgi:hypothetical protein